MTQLSDRDRVVAARRVLEAEPPLLHGLVAAPPIVVGSGPLAAEIVTVAVFGWATPGGPLEVHCVGADPDWAQGALAAVGTRGRLNWSEVPLYPAVVARLAHDLIGHWQPPAPGRGEPAGPTVYVSLDDDAASRNVAAAVARSRPDARVIAVVSTRGDEAGGTTEIAVDDALRDARSDEEDLARVLRSDARWDGDEAAPATAPPVDLFRGDGEAHRRLAEAMDDVLAAGNISRDAGYPIDDGLVYLTPGELTAMAERILAVLGVGRNDRSLQAALELAYRLPGLVGRVGWQPRRGAGSDSLLTEEKVEALARLVHLTYLGAAIETDNATGSPYAGAMWSALTEFEKQSNRAALAGSAIMFAREGLNWSRASSPTVWLPADADQLERMAEAEHRRWAQHQRDAGRDRHKWVKPWSELSPTVRVYDERIVEGVARFLSFAGIQIS